MAYLSLPEILGSRLYLLRPDVLSDLTWIMAEFERQTGKRTYVPARIKGEGGVRSRVEQRAIKADSVKAHYRALAEDESRHVLGAAFHLEIVGAPVQNARPPRGAEADYEILARIAESRGYSAGLHFKGDPDAAHYEKKESLAAAREKWATLTRERLWRLAGVGLAALAVYLSWRAYRRRQHGKT